MFDFLEFCFFGQKKSNIFGTEFEGYPEGGGERIRSYKIYE